MTLPKKTLLLLGLAFTGLVGVLYTTSSTILAHNIRRAEQENARQVVAGVLSVLNHTQEDFSSRFVEWAVWDDTYTFVQNANKAYIKSNLDPQQLALVKLNLIVYTNFADRVVYGTGFDWENNQNLSVPQELRKHLVTDNVLLKHPDKNSVVSGIVLLPEGPMLIASRPILTSQGEGPIRGALIIGRYVNNEVIKDLTKITQRSLSIHEFNKTQLPSDFQAVRSSLSQQGTVVVRPLNEQTLAAYTMLTDIYGNPALLLRVEVPRELYKQGQHSQRYLIASLLLSALVFGAIILLLIQRLVLFLKQRQQAEIALRQAEAKYRSIFENAVEGIFQTTPDGRYLSANPALARIYGYESPELLIASLSNIKQQLYVDPDLRTKFVELMAKDGVVLGLEAQVYCQDGSVIWICESARAIRDANGTLLYYEGTVEDITERKQSQESLIRARVAESAKLELEKEITDRHLAEAALRASLATNLALLKAIPDPMFRISSDGILMNIEAAKSNHLPLTALDFLGKHLCKVLPPEVAQLIIGGVERAIATGDVQILEYQLLLHEQLHDYEARIAVCAPDEVMAIVRDITHRKQAEAEVRNALAKEKELGELKSRFVTMTSHEFRTPLTTILSSAELLERYSPRWSDEKKLNHLQRIQTTVKHMTRLLNDVLLIGKAEAGKLECKPAPLDVVQFCRELVEEMQSTTKTHTVNFVSQTNCIQVERDNCNKAYLDNKLLRHILSNLLSNAIKYSPHGDSVDFELI